MSDLIERMRSFELDHEPHGWPAVQMRDISALCDRLEQAETRVAELEEGLHGIANCAYGYNHPKAQTADEAASWMNGEAMLLLGDPQPKAYVLRKQAEAVEAFVEPYYRTPFTRGIVMDGQEYAQRLRQQADEAERAGGEQ